MSRSGCLPFQRDDIQSALCRIASDNDEYKYDLPLSYETCLSAIANFAEFSQSSPLSDAVFTGWSVGPVPYGSAMNPSCPFSHNYVGIRRALIYISSSWHINDQCVCSLNDKKGQTPIFVSNYSLGNCSRSNLRVAAPRYQRPLEVESFIHCALLDHFSSEVISLPGVGNSLSSHQVPVTLRAYAASEEDVSF